MTGDRFPSIDLKVVNKSNNNQSSIVKTSNRQNDSSRSEKQSGRILKVMI